MKISTVVSSLSVALALAACSSSGGSSSLTADQIQAMPITAKMPTKGKAVYKAKSSAHFATDDGTATLTSDVSLSADFATSSINARVANMQVQYPDAHIAHFTGTMVGTGEIINADFIVYADGTITGANGPFNSEAEIYGTFKGPNAEGIQGVMTIDGFITDSGLIAIRQ
jgi:hypothetical protein